MEETGGESSRSSSSISCLAKLTPPCQELSLLELRRLASTADQLHSLSSHGNMNACFQG